MNGKMEAVLHGVIILIAIYMMDLFLPTMLPIYKNIFIVSMVFILILDLYSLTAGKPSLIKYGRIGLLYLSGLFLIVLAIFYLTKILVLTDAYGFESALREHSGTGKLLFFIICFLQPILLPLPEAITIPAGSAVFGPVTAAILGFTATLSGIVVMFWLARIGGLKLISRFIKGDQLEKYQKYVEKNETLILLVLFVIPILPDEIICVGAGIGGVSFKRFLGIAAVSKLAAALLLAFSIHLAKLLSLSVSQVALACSMLIGGGLLISFIIKRKMNKSAEM